jgi:hypothetical protein
MELQGQPGQPEVVIIDASVFQPLLLILLWIFLLPEPAPSALGEVLIQLNG